MTGSGSRETLSVKNGAQHIQSVRDGRSVYLNGKLIHDVSEHAAYRNAVASAGSLYDYQSMPDNLERMTFDIGGGRRVNRCWQLPRSYDELVQRRKALVEWAEISCGFLGRSPDHVASSMSGMMMGIDVLDRHDEKRGHAFREWFDYVRKNDMFLTYVINNVQGDRSKAFGDQGKGAEDMVAHIVDQDSSGITIRGAKLFATSAIMATEIFVSLGQPLKPGEEHLAFSCALPMSTKGINLLSRKSYEANAVSEYDNPLSSRFDENDALVFFDDVKVPWERLFVYRDTDVCRQQFHETPGHAYQNYQAQIRLSVKIRFLLGMARRLTECIGTTKIPAVSEKLGYMAAQASMVEAMLSGMEASGSKYREYWVPNKHFMYAAQVLTQDLYPQFINAIRDLSGGALIMLPSSIEDFKDPMLSKIIHTTQRAASMEPEDKVKFLKACWDA